jgi:hypothetical protein
MLTSLTSKLTRLREIRSLQRKPASTQQQQQPEQQHLQQQQHSSAEEERQPTGLPPKSPGFAAAARVKRIRSSSWDMAQKPDPPSKKFREAMEQLEKSGSDPSSAQRLKVLENVCVEVVRHLDQD